MTDRRDVLKVILGAALAAGASAHAQTRGLRVGVIGAGWFGKLNLNALMQVAPVEQVALADVDAHMLQEAGRLTAARPEARLAAAPALYRDYREMLAARQFDIVIVATPDHWHTLHAIAAMERGTHLYLEKPVSVDVGEAFALVRAAERTGAIVQVGTQRRTAPFAIEARERVVRAGLLGRVGLVELFGYFHQRPALFPLPSAPPPHLDWDFYCGPAPLIAHNGGIHPRQWRAFDAFGNGYMGDIGVHFIDLCRWLLGLGWPRTIASAGGVFVQRQSAATVPDTQVATFAYDDFIMTWTNRQWGHAPAPAWGAAIHGENGTLHLHSTGYAYEPRDRAARGFGAALDEERGRFAGDEVGPDGDRHLLALTRHNMRDFLAAIAEERAPASNIREGAISTATCALVNISMTLGRTLHWDGQARRVRDDAAANAMLERPYRAPWQRPR